MIAISLQSGSNGNCIYVESHGVKLLIDAGISGIQAEKRLAFHGREIRAVDAVIISHDHSDHISCVGVFNRKYDLPIFITRRTLTRAQKIADLGRMNNLCHFTAGGTLRFGPVSVETVPTPHDGADGVAFVVEADGARLGILTDLGHPFDGLSELIGSLDAVFIESNYDPEMLEHGPYPGYLKRRIKGPGGHLSNVEASLLLGKSGKRLKWICLAHLSEQNNKPDLALRTIRKALGVSKPIFVASRYEASRAFEL
jgi:phosphoribosyl 1,2-cyclic phosphodiesterase